MVYYEFTKRVQADSDAEAEDKVADEVSEAMRGADHRSPSATTKGTVDDDTFLVEGFTELYGEIEFLTDTDVERLKEMLLDTISDHVRGLQISGTGGSLSATGEMQVESRAKRMSMGQSMGESEAERAAAKDRLVEAAYSAFDTDKLEVYDVEEIGDDMWVGMVEAKYTRYNDAIGSEIRSILFDYTPDGDWERWDAHV